MTNDKQEVMYQTNPWKVLLGILVGGVAGAVTMFLLTPQSGKDSRNQIQKKGIEVRDRTSELVEDTLTQVRSSVNKIMDEGREKLKSLRQYGQGIPIEKFGHASEAAQAGKKAIQSS